MDFVTNINGQFNNSEKKGIKVDLKECKSTRVKIKYDYPQRVLI